MSEARHQIVCTFDTFEEASIFRDILWITIERVIKDIQQVALTLREGPTICCFTKAKERAVIGRQRAATIAKLRTKLPPEKVITRRLLEPKGAEEVILQINRLGGIAATDPVATKFGTTSVVLWDVIGTYDGKGIGQGVKALLKVMAPSRGLPTGFSVSIVDSDCVDPHEYPNKPEVAFTFKRKLRR